MLGLLALAFLLVIILINLVGLALCGSRLLNHYPLARAVTPVMAALALFFFEHFVGLGRLTWCWPLTTLAAVWMIVLDSGQLRRNWQTEAVFLACFAWVFAWRYSYPGIVASSEKLGDLAMIASYVPGTRLPPVDSWYPPYPFDIYYSFQHYAAALLGRVFGMGPGFTYNIAFSLLGALTIFSAALGAYTVCRSGPRTALVTVAFALGGTGAVIPVHFMVDRPELHASMRFIGDTATYEHVETAFGRSLLETSGLPHQPAPKLPSETFAYMTALGDYHPPLSGFYLLSLAFFCIALVERDKAIGAAQAVLAATIPLCAIANAWTLPLQTVLVVTWVMYRVWHGRPVAWPMLAAGLIIAMSLSYPFLGPFAYRAMDYNVRLRLVPAAEHTPLLLGLIVLWPILAAIGVLLISGWRERWLLWAAGMWMALLLFSEIAYVDDVYQGIYSRFNTTLKWWPWIQAGALLQAGAHGFHTVSRSLRWAAAIILSTVSVYAFDLGNVLIRAPKSDFGRLDGMAWITNDQIERAILDFLTSAPRGIVLQRLEAGAFTPAPAIALFAGQQAFLGWPEHEKLWRGQRADVAIRDAEVKRFYAGEMPESAEWLLQNDIAYVLWLKSENGLPRGTFDRIDGYLHPAYFWQEYYRANDFRVGVWIRRKVPAFSPRTAATPRN
jgi:uncharacterized membrane protein